VFCHLANEIFRVTVAMMQINQRQNKRTWFTKSS